MKKVGNKIFSPTINQIYRELISHQILGNIEDTREPGVFAVTLLQGLRVPLVHGVNNDSFHVGAEKRWQHFVGNCDKIVIF